MDSGGQPTMTTLTADVAAQSNTGTDVNMKKQHDIDARLKWRQKPSPADQEGPETDFESRLRKDPTVMDNSWRRESSQLDAKIKRKMSIITDVPTKRMRPYESLRRKQTVVMADESMRTHKKQSVLDLEIQSLNSSASLGTEQSMMDTTNSQVDWPDIRMSSIRQETVEMSIKGEPSDVLMREPTLETAMSIKSEPSFFSVAFDSDDEIMPTATLQEMASEEMSVKESSPAPQVTVEPGVIAVEDYEDCHDRPVPLWRARYSVTAGPPPYTTTGSVYKQKLVVKLKNRAVSGHRSNTFKGKRQQGKSGLREEDVPTSSADDGVVIKCEPASGDEGDQADGNIEKAKKGRRKKSPPVCRDCQQIFCSRSSLKRHYQRKHRVDTDLPFSCSLCDSKFARLMQLRSHERWHRGGDKTFPCQQCDVVFTRACHLKVHMRKHTGERPYTCSIAGCKSTFRSTSNLNRHLMKHSGMRPYECTVCQANFYQSSHLVSHVRRHTGERPFQCSECSATFTQLTHLHRHRSMHTGHKPHQCEQCGAGFVERCALMRHMKSHRRGEKAGVLLKIRFSKRKACSSLEEAGSAQPSASSSVSG